MRVFLSQKEFQILDLVLSLAALSLPLKVSPISMLSVLDELVVQFIVLFD